MNVRSLSGQRPSPALAVACLALFVALGGVGWAATQLPANSVGTAQLQNNSVGLFKLKSNSVGSNKIINGSIGAAKVNSTQIQLRVASSCATGAVNLIGLSGSVSCTPTLPGEFGTSSSPVALGTGSTQLATESLPAGSSYLVLAYAHAVISGAGGGSQRVEVDCTLSVPSSSATQNLAVLLASSQAQSWAGSIPLVLPVPASSAAQTATVACSDTTSPAMPAPTVSVDTTINAIQTVSNR
jgi:hypothetical protein